MGRKKIKMQKLMQKKQINVTFQKRKLNVFKKAMELFILTEAKVMLTVVDKNNYYIGTYMSPNMSFEALSHPQLQYATKQIFKQEDYEKLFDNEPK